MEGELTPFALHCLLQRSALRVPIRQGDTMTPSEFEQRKRALEEQLRSGIEILQKSFQIQLRALELMRWSEGTAGDLPDGSPDKEPRRQRSE